MNLERFKIAQADPLNGFDVALSELRNGHKKSHWIWYIFPQLSILGRSPTAQFYGVENAAEALEYVNDAELAPRLIAVLEAALEQLERGVKIEELMGGYTDSLKLVSSCTLFKYAIESVMLSLRENSGAKVHSLADRILEAAEGQGFSECSITRSIFE